MLGLFGGFFVAGRIDVSIASLVMLSVAMAIIHRIVKVSTLVVVERVVAPEKRINKLAGEDLLQWESSHGPSSLTAMKRLGLFFGLSPD